MTKRYLMALLTHVVCLLATLDGVKGDRVGPDDFIVKSSDKLVDPHGGSVIMTQEELDLAATTRAHALTEYAARDGRRPRNCTSDMRPKLPACKQATPFWCWATGITDLHYYYNASEARTCKSVECEVTSLQTGTDCCAEHEGARCFFDAASVKEIAQVAKQYLQRDDMVTHTGPPTEDELITLLEKRVPMMVLFQNAQGGGHVELLGGCDPHPPYPNARDQNSYFLHDPMTGYWMNKTYNDLVTGYHIQPPWAYAMYIPPSSRAAL